MFDEIVAEDVLPKVLHRFLLIPAVIGTRDVSGLWNTPGSQRTVLTGDGRELREEVVEWIRPRRFAYRVDGFSGAMGRFVSFATGEWDFRADGTGSAFRWRYSFTARSAGAAPAVRAFVRTMWAGYMSRCRGRFRRQSPSTWSASPRAGS